ncbi:MAG TPA: hypothetical protein P5137_09445 [Candidatus Brocadiia bacterium]|nr:hypothetical protein [Candidatus Brocadiia bacterium]
MSAGHAGFHPSAQQVFRRLDALCPGAALAAFGQTVFWDEPMKRIALEARDCFAPGRRALAGAHDLDFFSRMPQGPGQGWAVLAHNDTTTRDLWSAAGEMAELFGCEAWAARDRLTELGLRLNVALGPKLEGLDRVTEAWGWRGLALAGGDAPVVADLPAAEVADKLAQLVEWAAASSAQRLARRKDQEAARELGARMAGWVRQAARTAASVADLMTALAPKMWELAGGAPAPAFDLTRVSEVFRLNTKTAGLPRFRLLDLFVRSATAERAREAYDEAVAGAAIYALEAFGAGAIPFDLYVPGRGRGTLFVLDKHVVAHTNPRTVMEHEGGEMTLGRLAEMVERQAGPGAAVVGKAVTLAAMLASEFVFVLNETGSAYMPRVAALAAGLKRRGLEAAFLPVLRVGYRTWDALSVVDARLRLPEHLAQAFGAGCVSGEEFARRWRCAAKEQHCLLKRLPKLRGAADILSLLGPEKQEEWRKRLESYQRAEKTLLAVQCSVNDLKAQAQDLRTREEQALAEYEEAERLRGRINHERLRPLRGKLAAAGDCAERKRLSKEVAQAEREYAAAAALAEAKRAERRELMEQRRQVTEAFRQAERAPEAREARAELGRVERLAERERLCMARRAILAVECLAHTQARPCAWWLPLVDPSGAWYREIRRTAEFRLERLDGDD